jgi:hypothetical protein
MSSSGAIVGQIAAGSGISFANNPIIKLGIKAPPGTKIAINEESNIFVVGRNGTLTINKPNYKITYLKFIREPLCKFDEEATKDALQEGLAQMDQALTNLLTNTKATLAFITEQDNYVGSWENATSFTVTLNENANNFAVISSNLGYYDDKYYTFLQDFIKGYEEFIRGKNGVYTIQTRDDENKSIQYKELQNVIIDYETQN